MTDNDIIDIIDSLDKETSQKIKKLLKRFKKSQDDMIEYIGGIVLRNLNDDGLLILSEHDILVMRDGITNSLSQLSEDEKAFVDDVLDGAYKTAFDKTAKVIGFKADWHILRQEFIDAARNAPIDGMKYSRRIWENCNKLANRIYDDIKDIVNNGTRPNHIVKAIKDDYGTSAYEAKRLVNTELARVVNTAQMDVYTNSGVVDKVMWCATLEGNTCDDCANMDGKEYALRKAPKLPLHPSCRCCLIPLIDGYQPNKRADNETKKNIDYKTYSDWKNK